MRDERRRSPRLAVRFYLRAEWDAGDRTVAQEVVTESISAHGALLKVMSEHPPAKKILLENLTSHEQQAAHVVSVDPVPEIPGTHLVRVEFDVPAPQFWGPESLYLVGGLKS